VPSHQTPYHRGGFSIDNEAKVLNVNLHLPLKGAVKVACLDKLFERLNNWPRLKTYFVTVSGDFNLFQDEPEAKTMLEQMTAFGTLSASPVGESYAYQSLCGQQRFTSFLGMKYDLLNHMKLLDADKDPELFNVWIKGDYTEIKERLGRVVGPLDWFVFKNRDWCSATETRVLDLQDFRDLGLPLDQWIAETHQTVPEYGNFLTDHMPLVTTVAVKAKALHPSS